MNKSLFEIQHEYLQTIEELEDLLSEGIVDDIPAEYLERLNINKDEFAEKARNYKLVIDSLNAETETIKSEIKRLSSKVKAKEATIDKLKYLVADAGKQFGEVTKTGNYSFKSPLITIAVVGSKSLVIDDEEKLPRQVKEETITLKLSTLANATKVAAWIEEKFAQDNVGNLIDGIDTSSKVDNAKVKAALIAEDATTPVEQRLVGAHLKTNFSPRFY